MNKFEETYLNIIKEESTPKAQLVGQKEEMCKVGKITRYFYQNELGSFQIAYEPTGSKEPFVYKYLVCRVELKRFKDADTSIHKFDSLEEAVKYGEEQLVQFLQEQINYYNGLRDWAARPRSGYYLD